MFLTKCPQNLPREWPENAWVGVTAIDTYMAVKGLQYLDNIKANRKFMSFEPLLSQTCITEASLSGIDWLIIGAQTNPYKPPEIAWVQEIVDAADKAGIPIFLKDNLLDLVNYQSPETNFAFNKEGFYRQEMPETK
jgi:protein gp37